MLYLGSDLESSSAWLPAIECVRTCQPEEICSQLLEGQLLVVTVCFPFLWWKGSECQLKYIPVYDIG